jgi:predicted permease
MKLYAWLRSLTASSLSPTATEADLDEELRAHIELRAADLERSGLPHTEALRRAAIEFGGRERFKEESREAMGGRFFRVLVQDTRFSLRVLRKSPGFTIVAIVTLAVAIGANSVVFGVLNGLILRPLDVPQPESLYGIEHATEHSMYESYPDYVDLRDRNRSFEDLAGFTIVQAGLDAGDDPVKCWANEVTANYFEALRIHPYIGRLFTSADDHGPNSAPYLVLSYTYWHNHFQDSREIIGRTVRVNKHPFTIIGVAPPGFRGTLIFGVADFFVPIVNQEQVEGRHTLDARAVHSTLFMTFGHLKPGVTPAHAAADLSSIGAYLEKTFPADSGATSFVLARPGLYGNYVGQPMRAFMGGLMTLAGLILLAACANLGSLFAARASDRAREIALRLALGAGRGRIVRQLLTEAVLISLVGGVIGLCASILLLQSLMRWQPFPKFPMQLPMLPDSKVYLMALLQSVTSGLLFGIVPVRQVLRANPYQIVKAGSGARLGRRFTARDILLVAQIAICAVLVTSSFVAVRGLITTLHGNFGFDPRNVTLAETELTMAGYLGDQGAAMQKRMIDTLAALPGVDSVSLIGRPPLYGGGFGMDIFRDSTVEMNRKNAIGTAYRFNIAPEYLRASGTVLLAGRSFNWHDGLNAPRVAIVNREFANHVFGSISRSLGAHFKTSAGGRLEIVGVVEDGKYLHLSEDQELAVFLPILQAPMTETTLVVRSGRDPRQLAAAIRTAMRGLDSGLPVFIESWNQALSLSLFPSRVATISLGVLGSLGALLAITGIFGMAAYSVSKRLKELGIRMALGARRQEVLRAAFGPAFRLLAYGSLAGLLLGLLASRVLASIVYHATPRDPLVLAGVVVCMVLLGILAAWIPARRVLALDPVTLLREE